MNQRQELDTDAVRDLAFVAFISAFFLLSPGRYKNVAKNDSLDKLGKKKEKSGKDAKGWEKSML